MFGLLSPIAALFANVTLDDAGNYAAIVAAGASVLLLIAGAWIWIRKKWLLINPVKVAYLIPKAEYTHARFPEAPAEEQYVEELSVASGTSYDLIHRLIPRQGVVLDSVRLDFIGPVADKPSNNGPPEPTKPWERDLRTGNRGERLVRDWWGVWHEDRDFPRLIPKKQIALVAHNIQTAGGWEGTAKLFLILRAEDSQAITTYEIEVPFRVGAEDQDQIPMLRRST